MEIRRIFQIPERRDAVDLSGCRSAALLIGRCSRPQQRRRQRTDAEAERLPAREEKRAARLRQERPPVLAAFSASHHHTVGKPETPYAGSGSGWLKRSQRA